MISKTNQIAISAKKDFLERLASTTALNAAAELIWNGLDAGADNVEVGLTLNKLGGIEEIRVIDDGEGISFDKVQELFGNLGDSWKKRRNRFHGRSLHGKNGEGRFKAFALGNHVEWVTNYRSDGQVLSYSISGDANALDSLSFTEPSRVSPNSCGTRVVIGNIDKTHGKLLTDDIYQELAKIFAAYLSQYPDVTIRYRGQKIDPGALQDRVKDIELKPVPLKGGGEAKATASIVEWEMPTKRAIHLCDASGVSLHEIDAGVQAPGFNFTVYIKSDHFSVLDKNNELSLDELHDDVRQIVRSGKNAVRAYFRRRQAERQRQIVERWKEEEIYPYQEKADLSPIEEAERQVFDILAVNIEAYLPDFDEAEQKSRKFTFQLVAQALRDNPASVQKIITQMLDLKQDEQDELAALLENTSFSNIIASAKTVANRLDFLVGLENLLFDKDTKKQLLERDQLHKILETEAWLFDEDFALSGSEQRLEEVLEKHIGMLGPREDGKTDVEVGDGKTGRIDLQLSRSISPRNGEVDYLVVELKRPSKKIDAEVITQVKQYAMAVADDERFNGVPAKWKFVAVSNEMNSYAQNDANQPDRPMGQVWESRDRRISVWVREWAEVINTARARLEFVNASLSYEANRDTAKEYLLKTHERFIPSSYTEEGDDSESESRGENLDTIDAEKTTAKEPT